MLRAAIDGWLARLATHAVLILMTACGVAGIWVATWFANATQTSFLPATPLLLLTVVAVSATGTELTRHRRGELALTKLRGGTGLPLLQQLTFEPLLSLLVGTTAGVVLGIGVCTIARNRWLGRVADTPLVNLYPVLAAATVAFVVLVVVVSGMVRALGRPVPEQTSPRERPSVAGPWALFGQTVVFAASALAIYQAVSDPGSSAWVVYAGPAVLGLAGGLFTRWVITTYGRLAAATSRRLGGSIAARRVYRTNDAGDPLMVLVAAGVVTVVAAGGALAVHDWVNDTGRVASGAPMVLPFDGDAQTVLEATEQIDPDGDWLMAGVRVYEDDRATSRRAFVDTTRYDRVVGSFLDTTQARAGSDAVARLSELSRSLPTPTTMNNGAWTVQAAIGDFTRDAELTFRIDYTGTSGRWSRTTELLLRPGETGVASSRINECADGCTIDTITVSEGVPCTPVAADRGLCNRPRIRVTRAIAASVDLLAQGWRLLPGDDGEPSGLFIPEAGSITIKPSRRGSSTLAPPRATSALPALATTNVEANAESVLKTPGGDERPVELVSKHAVLPIVSAGGTLSDLQRSLIGAAPTVPDAESLILARADTPAAVLAQVRRAGARGPISAEDTSRRIAQESNAAQADVSLVVAVAGLLIGALALAAPMTRMRRQRAHDEAVLRLMRVPSSTRRHATRLEVAVLATVAGLMVLIFGVVGVVGFLARSLLLDVPANQPPIDAGPGSAGVLAVIVGAAVAAWISVLIVGSAIRQIPTLQSRPAILREEAVR